MQARAKGGLVSELCVFADQTSTYLISLFIYFACDDIAAAVPFASVVVSVVVDIVAIHYFADCQTIWRFQANATHSPAKSDWECERSDEKLQIKCDMRPNVVLEWTKTDGVRISEPTHRKPQPMETGTRESFRENKTKWSALSKKYGGKRHTVASPKTTTEHYSFEVVAHVRCARICTKCEKSRKPIATANTVGSKNKRASDAKLCLLISLIPRIPSVVSICHCISI